MLVHNTQTHILRSYTLVLHAQLGSDYVTHAAHVGEVTGKDEWTHSERAWRHEGVLRECERRDASDAEGSIASGQTVWKTKTCEWCLWKTYFCASINCLRGSSLSQTEIWSHLSSDWLNYCLCLLLSSSRDRTVVNHMIHHHVTPPVLRWRQNPGQYLFNSI